MTLPSFTGFERLLLNVAKDHQIGSNSNATEVLFCVDEGGTYLIDCTVGEKTHTEITEKMKVALSANTQCKLIHNHPKQGSISKYDWNICLQNKSIVEIVAINTNGSIFRGSINNYDRLDEIINNLDCIRDDVELAVCTNNYNLPSALPSALTWTAGDIVNSRLLELGIIKYEVEYGQSDLALISDDVASIMIHEGKKTAASLIKKNFSDYLKNILDFLCFWH
jgi:hypothetical protein